MTTPVANNEKGGRSLSEFEFLHDPNDKSAKLGTGSFASVKLAKEKKTGKQFAIKIISMDPAKTTSSDLHNIRTEITIHRKLDHPNIVKFHNYIQKDNNVYLILDFANNGNLYSYMHKKKNLQPEEIFRYFYQTCLAFQYLHQNDVLHRDLKPENLLLDKDRNIKLCDFGWATRRITEKRLTFCGTYEYMAPEIVHKKPYDYRVDIWSLGVLLYELIHREAPYKGRSLPEITKSLAKTEITFNPNINPEAKDLILKILKTNPSERLALTQILSHPWVQSHLSSEESDDSLRVEEFRVSPKEIKLAQFHSQYGESPRLQMRKDNVNFKSEILTSENRQASELGHEAFESATRKNSNLFNSFNIPTSLKERERERFKDITKERERREKEKVVSSDNTRTNCSAFQRRSPLQEFMSNRPLKTSDDNQSLSSRGHIKSTSSVANNILEKLIVDEKQASQDLAQKKKIFESSLMSPHFKSKVNSILHQLSSHTTTHKSGESFSSIFNKKSLNPATPHEGSSSHRHFSDFKKGFSSTTHHLQLTKQAYSNKSDGNESCATASSSATLRPKQDAENMKSNHMKSSFHKKITLPKGDNCPTFSSPFAKNNLTTRSRVDTKHDLTDSDSNLALSLKNLNIETARLLSNRNFSSVLSGAEQNKTKTQESHVSATYDTKVQKGLESRRKQSSKAHEDLIATNLHISSLSERRNENKENKKEKDLAKDKLLKFKGEYVSKWAF